MKIFERLALQTISTADHKALRAVDQDPFTPGLADGQLSETEVRSAWNKAQALPQGDPRKESIRKAAVALGIIEGDVPATLFVDGLDRISLADLAPEARAVATMVNESIGLVPVANFDAYLDKAEVKEAILRMDETGELTAVQKAYLTRFGGLFGIDTTPAPVLPIPGSPFAAGIYKVAEAGYDKIEAIQIDDKGRVSCKRSFTDYWCPMERVSDSVYRYASISPGSVYSGAEFDVKSGLFRVEKGDYHVHAGGSSHDEIINKRETQRFTVVPKS